MTDKGGRPKIESAYKKTKNIHLKMNKEEYDTLIPIAKKLGHGSVAEGIRKALRLVAKYEY